MTFLQITPTHIGLWVWLKPGAKRDAVLGFGARGFEMAVKARAIEGEANLAMIALLAKYLGIPKTAIVLAKGQQSRQKYLEIKRIDGVLEKLNGHTE
jgi:uncharacterized protein